MRSPKPILFAAVVLFCAATAWPATFSKTERYSKDFQIEPDGTLWIDNPFGNIEIIGTDSPVITLSAEIALQGVDAAAVKEARDLTQIYTTINRQTLVVKTATPVVHNPRWFASVAFTARVPRTMQVRILSQLSDRIHVTGTSGAVSVKNINGAVVLDNVTGATSVDTANGSIYFDPNGRLAANAQLQTVNGEIQVAVAPDAAFRWNAQTLRGDFRSNLMVRGSYDGANFRGFVNAPRGPVLTTVAMMGNVVIYRKGTPIAQAQSVRTLVVPQAPADSIGPVVPRAVQKQVVDGNFEFTSGLGDVQIGQVHGNAKITTRAGLVQLGMVTGQCIVATRGGPLTFGDIFGPMNARTGAGDIVVNAARSGGTLWTDGGMIRVVYAGGAMTLHSGGGDITVHSASGSVNADTRSGDVTISIDPGVRTQTIVAKSLEGNVVLNVTPRFAADIDATILTSDADANSIRSDFNGLSIRREPAGSGKTRIRATGKVNGGGDRVELYATDGDIVITGEVSIPLLSPMP